MVQSKLALKHREPLIQAAHIGDFWDWGNTKAQTLFQGLTIKMNPASKINPDGQHIYQACLAYIPRLLAGLETNVYLYGFKALTQAATTLNKIEKAEGQWLVIESLTPFTTSLKKKYPVVLAFLKRHSKTGGYKAALSQCLPDTVAKHLSEAFSSRPRF